MQRILTVAGLMLVLGACSPDGNTPKIAESQRDALDKARQVESVIGEAAQQQQEQADRQSQ